MPSAPMTSQEIVDVAGRLVDLFTEDEERVELADLWEIDLQRGRELAELVDLLGEAVPAKLDGISFVIDRLKADAAQLREWEKELAAKRKTRDRAIERLRQRATEILTASRSAGQFTGDDGKIKVGKDTGAVRSHWLVTTVSIDGPEEIDHWPEGWQSVVIKPDKRAALGALKSGEERDGFRLVEREGWRAR